MGVGLDMAQSEVRESKIIKKEPKAEDRVVQRVGGIGECGMAMAMCEYLLSIVYARPTLSLS